MTWVIAILLAVAAFVLAAFVFRLPMATWSSLAAALVFGLAGYTFHASPDLPGAPRDAAQDVYEDEWQVIDTRKALVGDALKSNRETVLMADAFARRGQFADAAGFLRNALADNPEDFEAWLALGIALTEQADGILTQASVYAYSQAERLAPANPAPDYFLGLSLIRQGRMMEARQVWRSSLDGADPEDDATLFMAERVERLDEMLMRAGAVPATEQQQ